MNAKKKLHIASIVLVVWVFLVPILISNYVPPAPAGPRTGKVSTKGVFEPGGYILFTFEPSVWSVNGWFRVTGTIAPLLSEMDRIWPAVVWKEEFLGQWGQTIPVIKGSEERLINPCGTRLDIPDDPSLSGRTVRITAETVFHYPRKTSPTEFVNDQVRIQETLEISIGQKSPIRWSVIFPIAWFLALVTILVVLVVFRRRLKAGTIMRGGQTTVSIW